MNIFFEAVGYLAGICVAIAFLPQACKIIKTRDVSGISLGSYLIYNVGLVSWIVYGGYLHSIQMVIFNSISFAIALPILIMIIRYHKR